EHLETLDPARRGRRNPRTERVGVEQVERPREPDPPVVVPNELDAAALELAKHEIQLLAIRTTRPDQRVGRAGTAVREADEQRVGREHTALESDRGLAARGRVRTAERHRPASRPAISRPLPGRSAAPSDSAYAGYCCGE